MNKIWYLVYGIWHIFPPQTLRPLQKLLNTISTDYDILHIHLLGHFVYILCTG